MRREGRREREREGALLISQLYAVLRPGKDKKLNCIIDCQLGQTKPLPRGGGGPMERGRWRERGIRKKKK